MEQEYYNEIEEIEEQPLSIIKYINTWSRDINFSETESYNDKTYNEEEDIEQYYSEDNKSNFKLPTFLAGLATGIFTQISYSLFNKKKNL